MRKPENKYIKCPVCGTEYLPAEIYLPKEFVGNPTDIQKSTHGDIIFYSGKNMNLDESYICDTCGKAFKVKARVVFEVEKDTKNDFSEEYTSSINSEQISLFEIFDV